MPITPPSRSDVLRLAAVHGFAVSEDDVDDWRNLVAGGLAGLGRLDEMVEESQAKLDALASRLISQVQHDVLVPQEKLGVVARSRITTRVSPEHPETSYIPLRNKRAMATELVLGLVLGVAGAYYTDRLILRIRRHRRRSSSQDMEQSSALTLQQRQTSG